MKKKLVLRKEIKNTLAIIIGILAHIAMEYIYTRIQTAIRVSATEAYLIRWQVLFGTTLVVQAASIIYLIMKGGRK